MIERQHGQVAFTCDSCTESTELFDDSDFEQLLASAKSEGWKIEKTAGEWGHQCPTCASESALDRARKKFGAL